MLRLETSPSKLDSFFFFSPTASMRNLKKIWEIAGQLEAFARPMGLFDDAPVGFTHNWYMVIPFVYSGYIDRGLTAA